MVWGKLGLSERGRETYKLNCEEAFKQRRACEKEGGSQYLKQTEKRGTCRRKKSKEKICKVTIVDIFWELAAGSKR